MTAVSQRFSLAVVAVLVLLAAASGTTLAHEGHDSTPTTPLEPDRHPRTGTLVAGVAAAVVGLLTLGIDRSCDHSIRITTIGLTVAGLSLVYVSLALLGVI